MRKRRKKVSVRVEWSGCPHPSCRASHFSTSTSPHRQSNLNPRTFFGRLSRCRQKHAKSPMSGWLLPRVAFCVGCDWQD